jgi:hypothetical protein
MDCVRNTALDRKWSPPISGRGERLGVADVGVADDGEVVAERLEGLRLLGDRSKPRPPSRAPT